jgi:serine/threonine protein kinase
MVSKEELVETSEGAQKASGQELHPSLSALPEQYEILGKISQGGMGAIFKAKNRYTGAFVAIKVLKAESSQNEKALARFVMEARSASSLNHPRVCQVRDFGLTTTKIPYLVMDWINGISLSKKVQADGPQSSTEAVNIFQQICAGLEHAHAHKVVHRDLKPDNIMLTRDSEGRTQVHIVDFGIAKLLQKDESDGSGADHGNATAVKEREQKVLNHLTTTGTFVGTPLFMSPEQAKASMNIDERSDIYSLGCLMYYVLCGEPPLVGNSAIETIAKHLHQTPADFPGRLKIPADLRAIVFKSMEKKPSDRYQKISDLASDLKKLTKGVTITRHPLVSEREKKRKKLIKVASFILGFGLMYAVSIGVQNLLDTGSKVKSANKSSESRTGNEEITSSNTRTTSKNNASEMSDKRSVKTVKLKSKDQRDLHKIN